MSVADAMPRLTFNGVWPTYLIKRTFSGVEEQTAALAAFVADQEAREKDYTARYQDQNLFASESPAVRWLRERVDETASAFLQQVGIGRQMSWTLFGWYNTNRLGDHHTAHTHPRSYLSGTYYVRVPEAPAGLEDQTAHSACISFYDPRAGANMVTAGGDPDSRDRYLIRPVPGTLMMWPSPVYHAVHPNLSEEHRVSISFNLIIDPGYYWPEGKRGR